MSLEVTVEEEHLSLVLGDLAQRRGTVRDIQSRHSNKVLLANVPLAEMMVSWHPILNLVGFDDFHLLSGFTLKGYSTVLRTLTSGNATFSLELDTYEAMNPQDQNTLLKRMSGLLWYFERQEHWGRVEGRWTVEPRTFKLQHWVDQFSVLLYGALIIKKYGKENITHLGK